MKIRRRYAIVGVIILALAAAGISYATIPDSGNVYTACMLKNVGTVRLIDKSLPSTNVMSHCTSLEAEISWNQKGQDGKDGINGTNGTNGTNGKDGKDGTSVTTASEAAGTNCAAGGVQLNAVSGVSYVCNGRDGRDGTNGTTGTIRQVSDTRTFYTTGAHQASASFSAATDTVETTASCDSGDILVGGGFSHSLGAINVTDSRPTPGGWYVRATDEFPGPNQSITAYALCASPNTTITTTSVYGP